MSLAKRICGYFPGFCLMLTIIFSLSLFKCLRVCNLTHETRSFQTVSKCKRKYIVRNQHEIILILFYNNYKRNWKSSSEFSIVARSLPRTHSKLIIVHIYRWLSVVKFIDTPGHSEHNFGPFPFMIHHEAIRAAQIAVVIVTSFHINCGPLNDC